MKISSIQEIDKTFKLINSRDKDQPFEAVVTPPFFELNSIILAKNKKFLATIMESYSQEQRSQLFLILSEKIERDLASENFFHSVGTVKDIELLILSLSKEVYQKRMARLEEKALIDQKGAIDQSAKIDSSAKMGRGVKIGKNCQIMANVTIGDGVVIGDNCLIFPSVTLYPFVKIGDNCRIHSGTVIGADGFGYHFYQGAHQKIWHSGGVIVEDHVEIGALSAIDGGTFVPTRIGAGTKIDNHVQIGHNVILGKGVILCGHVALAGSAKIGDFTLFGGYSGCGPGVSVGAMSQVAGGALINCDWPEKSVLGGHPARPLNEWMKGIAYLRKMSLKSGG